MMRIALALALLSAIPASAAAQAWVGRGGSASGGGISATAGSSVTPRVAVDAAGRPTVAWFDNSSGDMQLYLRRWDGSQWAELGGSASGGGISNAAVHYDPDWNEMDLSLALDPAGNPVVTWARGDNTVMLRRWNGSAWIELGGSGSGGGVSGTGKGFEPRVALDIAGNPVVAWDDWIQVYLKRWNPGTSQWEALGSSTTGLSPITGGDWNWYSALAVDASGHPALAWMQQAGAIYTVLYRRWTGSAWAGLGGSDSASGIATGLLGLVSPDLAFNAAGNPLVAWRQSLDGIDYSVMLKAWDGSSWVGLGGSGSGGGVSGLIDHAGTMDHSVVLALDSSGRPSVAWDEVVSGRTQVRLKQWSGSAWSGLAGSAAGDGVSGGPISSSYAAIAMTGSGLPVVAWKEATAENPEIFLKAATPPPAAPESPSQFGQLKLDGSPVTAGQALPDRGFIATAKVDDVNYDAVSIEVEVKEIGAAFTGAGTITGTAVSSGAVAAATVPGLAAGLSYHWQARAVDATGRTSAWVASGTVVTVRTNQPPSASGVAQVLASTGRVIGGGEVLANAEGTEIAFEAVVEDGDAADLVRFEVELRRSGEDFGGVATLATPMVASGTEVRLTTTLDNGTYAWRSRTVDRFGASSGWIGQGTPSFLLAAAGSSGAGRVCQQSSTGAAAAAWVALLGIALIRRSRRL